MSDALDDGLTVGADTSKEAPTAASGLAPRVAPTATPKKVEIYGPEYGKWLKSTRRDTPTEEDEADTLRAELLAASLADLRLALEAVTRAVGPWP